MEVEQREIFVSIEVKTGNAENFESGKKAEKNCKKSSGRTHSAAKFDIKLLK